MQKRRHYETPEDIAHERMLGEIASRHLVLAGHSTRPYPHLLRTDFLLADKDQMVVGVLECKWRMDPPSFTTYPEVMISTQKIVGNWALAGEMGNCPMYLCWRWKDGVYLCEYQPHMTASRKQGSGRTRQTRDKWDVETCDLISGIYWTRIADSPACGCKKCSGDS